MKGVTEFDKCYNRAYYYMWSFTALNAVSWRQFYRGAKHYGNFILSELDRKEQLEANGETTLARRGLVASDTILKAWLFNMIEECTARRVPMPPELLEALYRVLGCRQYDENEPGPSTAARHRFEAMRASGCEIPVRATARGLGVDPATISRWKAEPSKDHHDCDMELYREIRALTGIDKFLKDAPKVLRR